MRLRQLSNLPVTALLRSPLHGLLSRSVMLLTFTGRRSGRRYTTPVEYIREGETLYLYSSRERVWWRNLRGGAPVTVRLRGRERRGRGQVFEEPATVARGLLTILRRHAALRRQAHVALDGRGEPRDPTALARLARTSVVVQITELAESGREGS